MNQWTPKLSVRFAPALLSSVCYCLATSVAVADWTGTDQGYLRSIDVSSQGMLHVLEGMDDFWDEGTFGWYLRNIYSNGDSTADGISSIVSYLNSNSTGSLLWYLNALLNKQGSTNCCSPVVNVSVTNSIPPYDDLWIKRFLTGTDIGDSGSPPLFRYSGGQPVGTGIAKQSLQDFLSHTLGIFEDTSSYNSSTRWEDAFPGVFVSQSNTRLGRNYGMFTYWLAEGVRRLIATNQLTANLVDQNRRSVTENLSLILMELRDMASNSVSQVAPEFPQEISVTNQVSVEADEYATIEDSHLPALSGEVIPESYYAPSSEPLREDGIGLDTAGGNPVLTLWDDVRFSVGGVYVEVPSGSIDFGSRRFRSSVLIFGAISHTAWWLIYYLALARLLRREYVYYTSLGHTEGAA